MTKKRFSKIIGTLLVISLTVLLVYRSLNPKTAEAQTVITSAGTLQRPRLGYTREHSRQQLYHRD